MPVSGLVLTLDADPQQRCTLLATLAADARVTLGELVEGSLPVVTETDSMDEHRGLWHELAGLAGVLQIRLAYHDFSDVSDLSVSTPRLGGEEEDHSETT